MTRKKNIRIMRGKMKGRRRKRSRIFQVEGKLLLEENVHKKCCKSTYKIRICSIMAQCMITWEGRKVKHIWTHFKQKNNSRV
jgi:hypothetical protein